eukprot:Rhum_TRINITY_DN14977_c25_g1::Rhum_TRINITY_DN14977_c25_g1_i1::g.132047::m.132047
MPCEQPCPCLCFSVVCLFPFLFILLGKRACFFSFPCVVFRARPARPPTPLGVRTSCFGRPLPRFPLPHTLCLCDCTLPFSCFSTPPPFSNPHFTHSHTRSHTSSCSFFPLLLQSCLLQPRGATLLRKATPLQEPGHHHPPPPSFLRDSWLYRHSPSLPSLSSRERKKECNNKGEKKTQYIYIYIYHHAHFRNPHKTTKRIPRSHLRCGSHVFFGDCAACCPSLLPHEQNRPPPTAQQHPSHVMSCSTHTAPHTPHVPHIYYQRLSPAFVHSARGCACWHATCPYPPPTPHRPILPPPPHLTSPHL